MTTAPGFDEYEDAAAEPDVEPRGDVDEQPADEDQAVYGLDREVRP